MWANNNNNNGISNFIIAWIIQTFCAVDLRINYSLIEIGVLQNLEKELLEKKKS